MTKEQLYDKAVLLPLLSGVYIIKDKQGVIIYIGKAKKLRTRVSQYFRAGVPHDTKVSRMIQNAFEFDVIVTQSEFEALVLECSQIKLHKPKYNILLKDDKGYSYVMVSNEAYPRITAQLQKTQSDAQYIGPFTSSFAVREMVETTVNSFKLPTCNKKFPQDFRKARPCLNYHIGRCMGVCQGKISQEQYNEYVQNAVKLIKQGKGEIIKILTKRMLEHSDRLEFEKALLIRNQITAIEKVSKGQKVVASNEASQDIIAFAAGYGSVCTAILRFRNHILVDKREFVFNETQDIDQVRSEFLPRYYFDDISVSTVYESVPKVIAVDALPAEVDVFGQLLSEEKTSKVKIYVPERGDTAKLVQMAHLNAMERLNREKGRFAKEERTLEELAELFGLDGPPAVIESYDISNWGDGTSVAGMVVFENGKPNKAGYRRFKIKTVLTTDDYQSMAETLERRLGEYDKAHTEGNLEEKNGKQNQFAVKPDLILLDGGKGQVSVVKKVLNGTSFNSVPVFGMVKDNKHRTRAVINSKNEEISINIIRGVFTFITSIQDEVHRFAISYGRSLQKKKTFSSTLTQIEGVGEQTAKLLLKELKTLAAIRNASVEELVKIKGISPKVANNVYNFYYNDN